MDLNYILHKVVYTYLDFLLILFSFIICKVGLVPASRKNLNLPASKNEKISLYFNVFFVLGIGIWLFTRNYKNSISNFIAYFIIIIIPAFYGIKNGFEEDAKLTSEERIKRKRDSDKMPD